ncbi:MAG: hypothetical protein WAN33_04070 [Candidatus Acidiferrales bacterium]
MKKKQIVAAALVVAASAFAATLLLTIAQAQDRPDFLSPAEADKIREAQNPNDRIKLFLDFAEDRLKKLQYELKLTTPQVHKRELLNGLLNAYSSCIDEAADRVQEARQKGLQIRPAITDMEKRAKAYLETLNTIEGANGPELASYKESLDDAIAGTQDALNEAIKASKEYGSAPIRRKP